MQYRIGPFAITAIILAAISYLILFQAYWAAEPICYYEYSQNKNSAGTIVKVSFRAENCSEGDEFCLRNTNTGEMIAEGQVADNKTVSFNLADKKEGFALIIPAGQTCKLSVCQRTTLASSLMTPGEKPRLYLNSEVVASME